MIKLDARQINTVLRAAAHRNSAKTTGPTRFLLISKCAEGAGILERIQREGNQVGLYIQDPIYRDVYDGIVPKVNDWRTALTPGTVVLFDFTGLGDIADKLRANGYPVFGGSKLADRLEADRDFGLELMRGAGIKVPESKSFSDFKAARQFLAGRKKQRFVFKPSGKDVPSKLTYVSRDADDLLAYLDFIEPGFAKRIDKFDLQRFVEGAEVSSELWFDGKKAVGPATHTVEAKKFMNDDLGPATGCAGNIVWVERELCRIVDEGIGKAAKLLAKAGFMGQCDLNAIVNDQGVYGLEWTPRFGYDSMPAFAAMIGEDLGKMFADFARGQAPEELPYADDYAIAVRLSIPPYPAEPADPKKDPEDFEPNRGVPIRDVDPKGAYFYEVKRENGQLVHSGGAGLILAAVATCDRPTGVEGEGDELTDLFPRVYEETLAKAKVPNKQYRTDLGDVLLEMFQDVVDQEGTHG